MLETFLKIFQTSHFNFCSIASDLEPRKFPRRLQRARFSHVCDYRIIFSFSSLNCISFWKPCYFFFLGKWHEI